MNNIIEYTSLKNQIDELNEWFDLFLKDKNRGGSLDAEEIDNPLWAEYNEKYKMYMKIRGKMEDMERITKVA
jgi:hypothetical protein